MRRQGVGIGQRMATAAVFAVGSALIASPWMREGERALRSFALRGGVAILLTVLIYFALRGLWRSPVGEKEKGTFRRCLKLLTGTALSGAALYHAWECWIRYGELSQRLVLPDEPPAVTLILFLLCAVGVAGLGKRGMDAMSWTAWIVSVLCIIAYKAANIRPSSNISGIRAVGELHGSATHAIIAQ